jgi:hypothetical protein
MSNLNSGKPWSETDLLDLKPAPGIRRPPSSLHPPFVHLVVAAMVRFEVGLALEISIEGIANVLLRDVEEVRQKVASLKARLKRTEPCDPLSARRGGDTIAASTPRTTNTAIS